MTTSTLDLPAGRIVYTERGSGPPLVFVHGLLADGRLWDPVVASLSADHRCIVPELPLGSHREAMRNDADLSPTGLAAIVAGVLDALELVARVPGGVNLIAQPMRLAALRRMPLAYGWLAKHGLSDELTRAWVDLVLHDRAIRRDTAKLLRGISNRYTLEAARQLERFDRPALIAWALEDRFFKLEYGKRLADAIPQARLETVEDSYTFMPLDQPDRLATLVREFVLETAGAPLTESP